MYKKSIFNLFKIVLRFLEWLVMELVEFIDLEIDIIYFFLYVRLQGDVVVFCKCVL